MTATVPAPAAAPPRPQVLCVDDEPSVVEGLAVNLRRKYDVRTAPNGAEGLIDISLNGPPAVVISDMRMPGMDGSTFLSKVKDAAPNAVRMLLTGQADIESAIAAVNEGQIFRFLTKPCPPPRMLIAVAAAVEQHRLLTAERTLLDETLRGSIKVLTEIMALTAPRQFGRASRVRQLVAELCAALGREPSWQLDVAAMLSQLGLVTLPLPLADRYYRGRPPAPTEQEAVDRCLALTDQLLANIPRLEPVRRILALAVGREASADVRVEGDMAVVQAGAPVLRVALDFDAVLARVGREPAAVDELKASPFHYDEAVVKALIQVRGHAAPAAKAIDVGLDELRAGMRLDDDLAFQDETLLASRGHPVNEGLLAMVANHRDGLKPEVRVIPAP